MTSSEDCQRALSARQRFPSLDGQFEFAGRVGAFMYEQASSLSELAAEGEDEFIYKGVVQALTFKAIKTHRAIECLLEFGFVEDAVVLMRALLEIVINLLYIGREPESRATLYAEYDYVLRWQGHRAAEAVYGDEYSRQLASRQAEIDELRREYERVKCNYPDKYRWSGESVRKMAEEVGGEKAYLSAYRMHSELVHSAPTTMNRYVTASEGGLLIDLDPKSEEEHGSLLCELCELSLCVMRVFNEVFQLGNDAMLDELRRQHAHLFR